MHTKMGAPTIRKILQRYIFLMILILFLWESPVAGVVTAGADGFLWESPVAGADESGACPTMALAPVNIMRRLRG